MQQQIALQKSPVRRPPALGEGLSDRAPGPASRWWRWAGLPFGVVYLVLLAVQFSDVIRTTNLNADAVSGPVIAQLFGSAPAHASVVLGEFGWYSTLLFDLATKWLPLHREIWETAPYAMALAGAGLAAWSVSQIATRWAAGLTAVLLVCASPAALHLFLSTTQHAPDWLCLALLGAFAVLLERRAAQLRWFAVVPLALVVGTIVGVNAASDPLVTIAAVAPFGLALIAGHVLGHRGPHSARALWVGGGTLAVVGITWVATAAAMSALGVAPEPGLHPTMLATSDQVSHNVKLWWQSVAVLGNGDFFGQSLSVTSALAVACAAMSLAAIGLIPLIAWRTVRPGVGAAGSTPASASTFGARAAAARPSPARTAFIVFWCSSALLLTGAFLLSAAPVDIHADRYLVGLLYAGAAVVPTVAAGRPRAEAAVLAGTCVFALAGVISMAQGAVTRSTEGFLAPLTITQVEQLAARNHLTVGYAGYWDAAPITWASNLRTRVYPVAICDQGKHLCRFDLHVITSWYSPRPGARSFLLVDPSLSDASRPTPDLGRPIGVYQVGRVTMYAYPYDIASKIVP